MTTGEKLSSLRKQNNYTQEELADIMNVSRQSVSRWESDIAFPETEKLIALSKLYNCSIDYLLQNDNNDRGTCSVTNNKEETKGSYNKKRLPFLIATICTYIASIFLFATPWFSANGSSTEINVYNVFSMRGKIFSNYAVIRVFAAVLIVLLMTNIVLSIIYFCIDKRILDMSLKILNCLFLITIITFVLTTMDTMIEWKLSMLYQSVLSAILVIVQFAVPAIRKTR